MRLSATEQELLELRNSNMRLQDSHANLEALCKKEVRQPRWLARSAHTSP